LLIWVLISMQVKDKKKSPLGSDLEETRLLPYRSVRTLLG